MESGAHGCAEAALALYEELLSPSALEDVRRDLGLRGGGGLFNPALTIWLSIRRRLERRSSIELAWLSCSPSEALRLSPKSSRAKSGALSVHASGFDYARHHIPLALVTAAADMLFAEEQALLGSSVDGWYLLDGSSLTLERTSSLVKAFPASSNQHGPTHWPVVKIAVVHDLENGLAMRPEWGPMYGPSAVSEQALALKLIDRMPKACGVIADRNFGILQVAWALRDRPMLIRLTDTRAQHLLKGKGSLDGDVDVIHHWRPSSWEKRHHGDFTEEMVVPGRIVVRHVQGPKGKRVRVCLFTNDLTRSPEDLVLLYAKRWRIETDLRSLKQTVDLEIIRAKSPEMVAKELILGIAAYNIVRTVMAKAAELAGVEPRQLSFARARGCIEIFAARAATDENIRQLLVLIAARKQPHRKKQRAFPREVWGRGHPYPPRRSEETE